MKLTYDADKNRRNVAERGLSFDDVSKLDWNRADIRRDNRRDYGEERFIAYCPDAEGRLHNVVFTVRVNITRVISFRKANPRERKEYEQKN